MRFTDGAGHCCKMKPATRYPELAMTPSMIQRERYHGASSKFWRHLSRRDGETASVGAPQPAHSLPTCPLPPIAILSNLRNGRGLRADQLPRDFVRQNRLADGDAKVEEPKPKTVRMIAENADGIGHGEPPAGRSRAASGASRGRGREN